MQISLKTWQKYKNRLACIDEKAVDEMLKFLQQIGGFGDHAEDVIRYAYALSNKYGEAAAAAACEMYDAVAEASGVNVPLAEPAEMPDYKEVARAVNETVKNSSESMIPKTVGRLVKRAGADTTLKNAMRDGAQFAWVPTGDTCAFCLTLASRGWQYASKKALKNGHAEHIHGNCDCQYAIRFDDKTNIQGYDPDKYLEMYNNADGKSPKEKINALRRANYANNKDKINAQKRIAYAERKQRDFSNDAKRNIINGKKHMDNYINKPIVATDNQSIREWYVANVSNIPNLIDKTKSLEEQAKQAFELRNKYKHEARVSMSDEKTAQMLEKRRPAPSFEQLIERKMQKKGMSKYEAILDILETASKTNEDVNQMFGL